MSFFDREPSFQERAASLVGALSYVSTALLDEAEAQAKREHSAGKLTDRQYFVVFARLQILAGRPWPPDPDCPSNTVTTT